MMRTAASFLACWTLCLGVAAADDGRDSPLESRRCELMRLRPRVALFFARPPAAELLSDGLARLPECARDQAIRRIARPQLDRVLEAFEREIHPQHARAAGPDLLRLVGGLSDAAPGNRDLLLTGTRLNGLFAFALLDEEDPDEARRRYAQARRFGCALLEHGDLLDGPLPHDAATMRRRLARTSRADVDALSWAAFAWGLDGAARRGSPEALADQPLVEAILARVLELDERHYHALPHILLGFLFGSRTPSVGGDPARAQRHFEAALRLTKRRYLLTHVTYAKTWAVQAQDRRRFVDLLEEVLRAPDDLDPAQALANRVAKERAAKLLARVDDLILPEGDD